MKSQELKKYRIPDRPGVYIFKKGKKILYVGKATSLRDRVRSYFGKDLIETRGPIILDMVFKATGIKWQETDSVLEALILEANLIKKYQPIYNTKEKSDKSFNYVCITKEEFPKVIISRGKELEQLRSLKFFPAAPFSEYRVGPSRIKNSNELRFSKIYGPFPNASQLKEALKIIRRIFPFLDEKSKHNYEFYKQLGLSPLIRGNEGVVSYSKNIHNIKLFFEGKKKKIFKNLEKEMKTYAKAHEFEKASEIKKQLFALKHINDIALIKNNLLEPRNYNLAPFRIEAYDIAHMAGSNMVGVMTVVEDGEASKNEYRKFKIRGFEKSNDTGALREILERRFAHAEWRMPNLIVLDGGRAQLNVALNFQKKVGLAISTVAVVKDEKHRPKNILGDRKLIQKFEKEILLANHEAHRFAIKYHRGIMKL